MANRYIRVSRELTESILKDGTIHAFSTDLPDDVKLVGVLAYPSAGGDFVTMIVSSETWPALPDDAPDWASVVTPMFSVRR